MEVLKVNFNDVNAPILFAGSLRETGFAVINHHPISSSLIENVYAEWQAFFASGEKQQYLFDPVAQDGFFPLNISETAKGNNYKDIKEFYHFYEWGRRPKLTHVTSVLCFELTKLAIQLLGWLEENIPSYIANGLSMPLSDMIKESRQTLLRIIHYPALTGQEESGAIRAAAHEDINLITLLPTATAPGLQVQDRNSNWYEVPCDYNSIIVNAGDMLQMCTQGFYKSTTHRVINPPESSLNEPRYSMPLFLHPREDVILSENYTARAYLDERLRELGLK